MILEDILTKMKENSSEMAYSYKDESFTYSELYKYVCNIYNFLIQNNIKKKPIIIYGSKEIYMKASFLACSYAGITYVPIDRSVPKERVDSIINQVDPYCIIGNFESEVCKNISKDIIYSIMNKKNLNEIDKIYLQPEDIYYIIFTSGSTGIPKGVKVTYKNLDSCINWLKDITKIKKGVILNQAIFSFDLSVADLYLSLVSGSEHFILSNDIVLDFKKIFGELKLSGATLAVMTPSFADLLLLDESFNQELLPKLNTIVFCGEKLLYSTVEKLYTRFNNIKIINSYGPTECTFAVTSIEIKPENIKDKNISIGIPKKDVDIFILDDNRQEVQVGVPGEILISGESVADGYLGININKEKSFIEYKGKKAYLTGDIGYKKDGFLYYCHRKDKQIKYKGYRIELSDIEENLCNLKYIEKAKVLTKEKNDKIIKLIAFVKLKGNKTVEEIKRDLLKKIPEYMIPSIKMLEEFPINNNGKIDIEKLRNLINGR